MAVVFFLLSKSKTIHCSTNDLLLNGSHCIRCAYENEYRFEASIINHQNKNEMNDAFNALEQ